MFFHRLPLHVLVGVEIALAGIASDLGPSRAAPPSRAPDTLELNNHQALTLRLQNNRWNQIRVEVRVGPPNTTCDSLESLGVQVLQQGQEWEVQVDDPMVCWRRDQTPGDPASEWTDWHQVRLADGDNRVVTL